MKRSFFLALALMVFLCAGNAMAVPITVDFSDYPGAPTSTGQVDLDNAAANAWFNTNYGITFSNVYLYYDSRDTFDHIGVANDITGPGSTGWIYFTDTTNFVTVDYTSVISNDIYIDVFDSSMNLLDSFFVNGSGTMNGTTTLTGVGIAALSFHDDGGMVAISTLDFDYDGETDGHNDDINPVPEPATLLLLGTGLLGLAGVRRKKN